MVQYRDPGPVAFDAVIERPDGPGAYVTFPFSALDTFGVRARVPVKARFDGQVDTPDLSRPTAASIGSGSAKKYRFRLGRLTEILFMSR